MPGLFRTRRASLALKSIAVGALLAAGATMAIPSGQAQTIPADAQATCTVTAPTFAGWFTAGSVSPNGAVNPANSVTFANTADNCIFYRWSEQMFLWVTSPAPVTYGGGGGRIFDSPAFFDVSPPDAGGHRTLIKHSPGFLHIMGVRAAQLGPRGLPVMLLSDGRMAEVEPALTGVTGRPLLLNSLGKAVEVDRVVTAAGRKPTFLDAAGKAIVAAKPQLRSRAVLRPVASLKVANLKAVVAPTLIQKLIIRGIPIFIDGTGAVVKPEQGQADGSVLQAQNGSLIYYAIMVNDVYAYFLTGTKDGGITPAPSQFPTTSGSLAKVVTFASGHGVTFPDPNALAIELKTSWVEASSLPDASKYVTIMATVPKYDTTNSNHWTPSGTKTVLLAMVGAHVVGSTAGHPELVWATFEHFGNTPAGSYQYNSTSGPNPKTIAQGGTGPFLFSSGTAGPFNQVHSMFNSPNIDSISPFHISPSDTIKWKLWGSAFDITPNPLVTSSAAANTQVISINNSVLGQLMNGDIRANYFMSGSTWTIGGAAPTSPFKAGVGNEVGTSQLANSTMETYQQGSSNHWTAGENCFACHVGNDTDISHIFGETQALF